ncbi:MAG: DUF502 domain-containing protein [Planctomycetota bacterium]
MKRFFMEGLTALLPTILTLWIVIALFSFITGSIAAPVTRAVQWSLITNSLGRGVLESITPIRIFTEEYMDASRLPRGEDAGAALARSAEQGGFFLDLRLIDRQKLYAELDEWFPPVLGLALGFILIFVLGFFLRGYVGTLFSRIVERIVFSFPLVRTIYPYAKKIVDFLFSEKSRLREFQSVVAIPYPSPGRYSIGFVTSEGMRSLNDSTKEELISVFLPSSPTPMTGYVVFVRRSDIVSLDLSLDQTMALIISGGVILPQDEQIQDDESPGSEGTELAALAARSPKNA